MVVVTVDVAGFEALESSKPQEGYTNSIFLPQFLCITSLVVSVVVFVAFLFFSHPFLNKNDSFLINSIVKTVVIFCCLLLRVSGVDCLVLFKEQKTCKGCEYYYHHRYYHCCCLRSET